MTKAEDSQAHRVESSNLEAILADAVTKFGPLQIRARQPNLYASSIASEILACEVGDGSMVQIFCKYTERGNPLTHTFSHCYRHGLLHEITVYRDLLQNSRFSVPTYYGSTSKGRGKNAWLFIEYLPNCMRVNQVSGPTAMSRASRWLGEFHLENERLLSSNSFPFLARYDANYYQQWVVRARLIVEPLYHQFPWLAGLFEQMDTLVSSLTGAPQTIVHGDFYPSNVLVSDGIIFPVDWECTAVAVGELDLAALTEWWPVEVTSQCIEAYKQTRWPSGAPAAFERTFLAAQMHMVFRFLGDQKHFATAKGGIRRIEQLRSIAEKLDLI